RMFFDAGANGPQCVRAGAVHLAGPQRIARQRANERVEQRELDAGGAAVEDENGFGAHGRSSRLPPRADTSATAHDAMRDSRGSARLVSTMGTRAPSTMPALAAPPRNSSCLASMLPLSRLGTTRMSAAPATSETMPLMRAAAAETALSNAS